MFDYQLILENAENGKTRVVDRVFPDWARTGSVSIFEIEAKSEGFVENMFALTKFSLIRKFNSR